MFQLHDYQELARDFLRGSPKACLMLDMGLGKTAAALAALEPRHLPVLVVAPKRVAEETWPEECPKWRPDLSMALAAGEPPAREAAITLGADITVLGRDNLGDLLRVPRLRPYRTVIIDELSGYKDRSTARWKITDSLINKSPHVRHVWGLTGTPAPNGLLDLWAQIALLDGGARLGKNITTYRSRYFMPGRQIANGTIVEWLLREGSDLKIFGLLEDICLAMKTEGRIVLPPVTYNEVRVELPPKVRHAYNEIAAELLVDLQLIGGAVHTAVNEAVLTSKLSQICAGFIYEDPVYEDLGEKDKDGFPVYTHTNPGAYTSLHKEKVKAVQEIVESNNGSPVLVAYRYQVEKRMLQDLFGPRARTIDERGVVADWNAGRVPVLLTHPASAGHGLNLQHGGHTIVWTSLDWDLELFQQLNKRLLRQGQQHPVVIHMIMAKRSIDYRIRNRLNEKESDQNDLLAYLESPI